MPAKTQRKPATKQYTLGVKASDTEAGLFDLDCPSGATCQVRRPGPQGLIRMGLLDSLDSLTGIIKVAHFDRVDGRVKPEDVAEFAKDKAAVASGLDLMDKVVIGVVVQPQLWAVPEGDEPRLPERIYIDSVELDDKAYILQFAMGGTRDLETFRAQRAELLVNLSDGEGVPVPSE